MTKFKDLSEDRQWDIVRESMGDDWYKELEIQIHDELESVGFEQPSIAFSGWHSQGDGASFTCKHLDIPLFVSKHWKAIDWPSEQMHRWEEAKELGGSALEQLGFSEEEANGLPMPVLQYILDRGLMIFYGDVDRGGHHYVHERSTTLNLNIEIYSITEVDEDRNIPDFCLTREDDRELRDFHQYLEEWMNDWIVTKNKEIYDRLYKEYHDWEKELFNQYLEEDIEF